MTSVPLEVRRGSMPSSVPCARPVIPNIFGMDGPVMSASRMAVENPLRCIITASEEVTIDLPTPPLPLTIPMTFLTSLRWFAGSSRLCGLEQEPLLEQEEQLPEQPLASLMYFIS